MKSSFLSVSDMTRGYPSIPQSSEELMSWKFLNGRIVSIFIVAHNMSFTMLSDLLLMTKATRVTKI